MIEVQIGNIKKNFDAVNPSWINEQLARRRKDGEPVCVQVFIDEPQARMRLTTPDCPGTVGTRDASAREQNIFELWEGFRLNDADFAGNNLWAFLKQVSR